MSNIGVVVLCVVVLQFLLGGVGSPLALAWNLQLLTLQQVKLLHIQKGLKLVLRVVVWDTWKNCGSRLLTLKLARTVVCAHT